MANKGRHISHGNVFLVLVLIMALVLVPNSSMGEAKGKKPAIRKKVTLTISQKKNIRVTGIKKSNIKKTVWRVKGRCVRLSAKKKNRVVLKAVSKGKARLRAKVLLKRETDKKVYRLSCKITVKKAKKKAVTPGPAVTPEPTATPGLSVTPVPTATATPAATATPKPDVTPVPEKEGAALKDLYASCFRMGAAINGSSKETAAIRHEGMAAVLKKHYNSTTLSNLMKPNYLLDETTCRKAAEADEDTTDVAVTFDSCEETLKFCQENNIGLRGHVLVWHDQTPEWFFKKGYDEDGAYVSADVMEKRMENYIKNVLTYCQTNYPGVIYCWDVVNECVADWSYGADDSDGWNCRTTFNGKTTHWYQTMGTDYVYKAFEFARKYADEGVSLIYNDYNVFQVEKRNNICALLEKLKERGLVDGVGLQPTVLLDYPSELKGDTADSFENCLKAYGELDLEIQVTELSFEIKGTENRTEENMKRQADRYQEMFELLVDMDDDNGGPCNITSVSIFGICDDYPLYQNHEQCLYLWDKNCVAKEAFYRIRDVGEKLIAERKD